MGKSNTRFSDSIRFYSHLLCYFYCNDDIKQPFVVLQDVNMQEHVSQSISRGRVCHCHNDIDFIICIDQICDNLLSAGRCCGAAQ